MHWSVLNSGFLYLDNSADKNRAIFVAPSTRCFATRQLRTSASPWVCSGLCQVIVGSQLWWTVVCIADTSMMISNVLSKRLTGDSKSKVVLCPSRSGEGHQPGNQPHLCHEDTVTGKWTTHPENFKCNLMGNINVSKLKVPSNKQTRNPKIAVASLFLLLSRKRQ